MFADAFLSTVGPSVTILSDTFEMSNTLLATNLLSLLCTSYCIYLYLRVASIRRFPSSMLFYKVCVGCVMAATFLILELRKRTPIDQNQACTMYLSFLTAFTLSASLFWFFSLILNFWFSARNPFVRPQNKLKLYHLVTWSLSFVFGCITATDYGYREDFGLCWNRETGDVINWRNWVGYFGWVVFFLFTGVYLVVKGRWSLSRTQTITSQHRKKIIQKTTTYLMVYSCLLCAIFVPFGYINLTERDQGIVQSRVSLSLSLYLSLYLSMFKCMYMYMYMNDPNDPNNPNNSTGMAVLVRHYGRLNGHCGRLDVHLHPLSDPAASMESQTS